MAQLIANTILRLAVGDYHKSLTKIGCADSCGTLTIAFISGCGAAGSAGALGASGRRFESCHSDHLRLIPANISIVLYRIFGITVCFLSRY